MSFAHLMAGVNAGLPCHLCVRAGYLLRASAAIHATPQHTQVRTEMALVASQQEEPPESTAFAITMACLEEAYEAQAWGFLQEGRSEWNLEGLDGRHHLALGCNIYIGRSWQAVMKTQTFLYECKSFA